jgi:hypothetical protein
MTKIEIKYIYYKLSSLNGSIKHYFHFFYGVFIPIILEYIVQSEEYPNLTFVIGDDVGPMLKILLELPIDIKLKQFLPNYNELEVEEKYLQPLDKHPNINKKYDKFITPNIYNEVNQFMRGCIGIYDLVLNPYDTYDVVLIERKINKAISTEHFAKNEYTNVMKTSGSERRSIINHEEFFEQIKKMYPKKKVINVSLEYMPIFDQYHLFNNTTLVIAQHGASLAQIIFMKPNTYVIEIVSKIKQKENWFEPISNVCGINHYKYLTEHEHTTIDVEDFKNFVISLKNKK